MDIWDQDVDDKDFENLIHTNHLSKEKDKRYKIGFKDALDHHEQEAAILQKEFEKGVVDAFNQGRKERLV
jgi:hypothetical protein